MTNLFSHVKWFVDSTTAEVEPVTNLEVALILLVVVIAMGIASLVDYLLNKKGFNKYFDKKLRVFAPWTASVVRVTLGIILIYASNHNYLFAPNIELEASYYSNGLIWTQGILGVGLILGLFTRVFALLTLVLYFGTLAVAPLADVVEHVEYIGLTVFLFLEGSGPLALDRFIKLGKPSDWKLRMWSLPVLRISVGMGLAILAFSEKIFNLPLAQTFLSEHNWNFLSSLGVSDRTFILVAGTMELIFGLALVFNLASRLVITTILGLFITTAILLGVSEIFGHLFAVGVFMAIWINYDPSIESKTKPSKVAKSKSLSKS